MTLERLDNLVKTGEVHEEAADQGEFERLVSMARRRLADSHALARIPNYQTVSCISMPRTHRRNG